MRRVDQKKSGWSKDYINLLTLPDLSLAVVAVSNLTRDQEYRFSGLEPPLSKVKRL